MRKQLLVGTIAAAGFAAGLIGAPAAHADDQGFLNELQASGFQGWSVGGQQMPDGVLVAQGYMACNRLHLGESPDQLVGQLSPNDAGTGRMLIQAAQHNLCPDTL
ncbi:DUF732 domain-containing protein [Mycobacterium celatum]|uniref:DUF732 domain-containing protein n=1 Tax=Mycobacterium celatum TaxID=28045 RepID=A0A1X1RSH6_MYCCE|nr:DUF732 domain-containing protein [Mycobacterium celatum]ORV14691.1 hypothetical protein AWB95_08670 [Mycobacterium celatum]PIB76423.1 DUF732 domain-containing protein [Mycobacterium celatum]